MTNSKPSFRDRIVGMFRVYEDTNHTFGDVKSFYQDLRLNNLCSEKFRHVLLLLYWPIYLFIYFAFEYLVPATYHPVYSPLDDLVPFFEYFIIPYVIWYGVLVGIVIYTALFNIEVFYRVMTFFMLAFTITFIIYFVYPTCQELRPQEMPRDNVFARFVQGLHAFDSNENVCPSLHVIGGIGACAAALHCRRFTTVISRIILWVLLITICLSTVFLKQHSVIDVFAGLAVTAVCYPFTLGRYKLFT